MFWISVYGGIILEFVEKKASIKNSNCVKCGHCIAICPVRAISTDDYDINEVIEYNKNDFDIESDNLLNFIKYKRTIRNFKNQDIENEKIFKIIYRFLKDLKYNHCTFQSTF